MSSNTTAIIQTLLFLFKFRSYYFIKSQTDKLTKKETQTELTIFVFFFACEYLKGALSALSLFSALVSPH